jgi:hypothetical protein
VSPRTVLRLALAGSRTDRVRFWLTATSSGVAAALLVVAAAFAAIDGLAERYGQQVFVQPLDRSMVTGALCLVAVPVLALSVQCGLLGAPARERRLAAMRMAGATPRQLVQIGAAENAMAATFGSLVALAAFGAVVMVWADPDGGLLPMDVLPPWWWLVLIVAGVPLVVVGASVVALRRVMLAPFGVVRRRRERRPRAWPLGIAVALVAVEYGFARLLAPAHSVFPLPSADPASWLGLFILAAVAASVWASGGWIAVTAGRLLYRLRPGPATLIAARRLMADPWSGVRLFGALLVAVLVGGAVIGYQHAMVALDGLQVQTYHAGTVSTVLGPLTLTGAFVSGVSIAVVGAALLVVFVDRILTRRRAFASLIATGVPRSVLGRASLVQALVPAVPSLALAAAIGVAFTWASTGGIVAMSVPTAECAGSSAPESCFTSPHGATRFVTTPIPAPWADTATTLAFAGLVVAPLILLVAVVGLSLTVLRSSTHLRELRTG